MGMSRFVVFCLVLCLCSIAFSTKLYTDDHGINHCSGGSFSMDIWDGSGSNTKSFGCNEDRLELGSYGSNFKVKPTKDIVITAVKGSDKSSSCIMRQGGVYGENTCKKTCGSKKQYGKGKVYLEANTSYHFWWKECLFAVEKID